jgi:uncharacterized protein
MASSGRSLPMFAKSWVLLFDDVLRIHRQSGSGAARRFFWDFCWHYPSSARWLVFIHGLYQRFGFARAPALIVRKKTSTRYLSKNLLFRQRLVLIAAHYDIVANLFKPSAMRSLLALRNLPLAEITGKSGQLYGVYLTQSVDHCCEGELCLVLQNIATAQPLATLSLVFDRTPAGIVAIIGGLQGLAAENAKSAIIDATKELHGLRPKSVVLATFYAFCQVLNVQSRLAISLKNNPSNKIGRSFVANNDSFWSEIAQTRNCDGDFNLPPTIPEKTDDQVPAKRKTAWRHRNLLRDEISRQVASHSIALLDQNLPSGTCLKSGPASWETQRYNTPSGDKHLLGAQTDHAYSRSNPDC